ncbi:phosphohistidine phosphatase SixA [Gloeocapsa sp. PCC 73106]|uniref:phosphohistidine phosphatase SixA n=1 Tax=Gloeocapsa sp. PCC 73106 TaxID=102232 RepID=UPI0002AC4615|nr:phosphohistidine phosphatase SixA [Gloeocapsa sp. PCC 73106]ELR99670.1 phosphohistidine phosphatase, SixA [Gloeocapsa sp. PCC 73106]
MEVYLIRHGIAAIRGTYPDDDARPLVAEGKEKTTKVAKRLAKLGVYFDLILTSPLVRAKETARILLTEKLSDRLEEFSPLAPGGDLEDWLLWYQQSDVQSLALVGHQPDLGDWTEMLVWGEVKGQIVVKKAGIIGLNVSSRETLIGNCQLFLLTSPKWFI